MIELAEVKQALQEQIVQRKRAENRFRNLLESMPDAVILVDSDCKITFVNGQSVALLGYALPELLDHSLELIIPERFRTSYLAHLQHPTMDSEFELYIRRKDGSEFPVEVKFSSFQNEDGIRIANYIRDITKQVKTVEALAEERRLLHALMDNVPDLIYFKDRESRFTRINRAHALMLGVNDPEEALGKKDPDFQDSELSKVFLAEEAQIITTGRSVVNREEFNPTRDGILRWFSTTKVPIKDSKGNITGIVGITHDITRLKQTEEALLNSEEQFHSTFIYAAIGMALVGLDGRWLLVNKAVCDIVGYSELELSSKSFQELTHPDDLNTDLKYLSQLLAGEIESYQMEKRYFHKQGHEVWVLLSVSLVRDSEGIPLHFISQIQDITERKRTEAALKTRMEEEHAFQTALKLDFVH
ncbi:MAG: PAS domain S-box protein [Anaerolineaceae bacterium]|nr:PAS domain S-box protein [Anaerolineaceae bacterium]